MLEVYSPILKKVNLLYELKRLMFYVARDGNAAADLKLKDLQLTYMEAARLARKKSKLHPMRFAYVQSAMSARYLLRRGREYDQFTASLSQAMEEFLRSSNSDNHIKSEGGLL